MIRQRAKRAFCQFGPLQRLRLGVTQCPVFVEQGQRVFQITVILMTFFDRADPKFAFIGVCLGDRFYQRQRQLAFTKIIADVFAYRLAVTLKIQQIIDNLERDTKSVAVVVQSAAENRAAVLPRTTLR